MFKVFFVVKITLVTNDFDRILIYRKRAIAVKLSNRSSGNSQLITPEYEFSVQIVKSLNILTSIVNVRTSFFV